jgi:hypothetical protein
MIVTKPFNSEALPMAIKRITVIKECSICDGASHGCRDCDNAYMGEIEEEISFDELIFELLERIQQPDYLN